MIPKEKGEVARRAKETSFYKPTGFKGAKSHIDDKYGIDVDDIYEIQDILPGKIKENYALQISAVDGLRKDEWQLGYTMLSKLPD